MKPVSVLLALLGAAVYVHAASDSSASTAGTVHATTTTTTGDSSSPLDSLKTISHPDEWHMKPVRVVHARVQKDKPTLINGRFVSGIYGEDLELGYRAALDTVNTASVEGALMFVQAECINVNARAVDERCKRKNGVNNIVFYEIYIANSNESLAEYQDKWNAPEYGPMVPMDTGRCTPLDTNSDGTPKFPVECFQYNGDNGQPNVGPVVGAGIKEDEPRAPYPGNYWFSFPNSCPLKTWGNEKTEACRKSTRSGVCPIGTMPDGVTCTYAYDILGWVTIDDIVGITSIPNPETNRNYTNFTEWCEASKDHIEYAGDKQTNKPDDDTKNLPFWQDAFTTSTNQARAQKVVETYNMIVAGTYKSPQINASDIKHFKPLPKPEELRKKNPPCYYSVKSCNTGFGCARMNYSQICAPCKSAADGCETDKTYKYPTLAKAPRTVADKDTTTGSKLGTKGATGSRGAASSIAVTASAVVASVIAALML